MNCTYCLLVMGGGRSLQEEVKWDERRGPCDRAGLITKRLLRDAQAGNLYSLSTLEEGCCGPEQGRGAFYHTGQKSE